MGHRLSEPRRKALQGECLTTIRSRAPVRISFGGGGTDISPYVEKHGGLVLNTTIDRYAYCTVRETGKASLQSEFAKAACKAFGIFGPISVSHFTEAPAGSGLGGSSSLMVAIVKALSVLQGNEVTAHSIASLAYKVEREDLGIKGGWQDQFAAAYGGWNLMEFSEKGTKVVRLNVDEDTKKELLASSILVDLGKTRLSSDLIERQIESFKRLEALEALERMKDITRQMVVRILAGDVRELGLLLSEEWAMKKKLDSKISNEEIEKFHAGMLSHGAIGGKLLGAGNGGHMMFISDNEDRSELLKYVEAAGFRHVPFNFDSQGVVAWTA